VHEGDLAVGVGVLDDAVAEIAEGSVGRPEGAENDVGRGSQALVSDDLVGDLIDKPDLVISIDYLILDVASMYLRFKADNIANAVALVAHGSADLADRVDELDTEHPLGGSKLDLTSKVVDVLDQRSQDDASALGGSGSHRVDHIGSEVGVVLALGRHCVFVCMKMSRNDTPGGFARKE
jgi:hypothetical protein